MLTANAAMIAIPVDRAIRAHHTSVDAEAVSLVDVIALAVATWTNA